MSKLKLALCQIAVGFDKEKNVQKAVKMIQTASQNGSKLVVLPVNSFLNFIKRNASTLLMEQVTLKSTQKLKSLQAL
jgi:predicted amidohydrolase